MTAHDCVEKVNKLLAERNTMLEPVISWGASKRELIALATTKLDPKVRKKPINFFASFCPMCGAKLPTDTP